MKAKREIRNLRSLVTAHRLAANTQRKRIDEAMARIDQMEREVAGLRARVPEVTMTYPEGYTITPTGLGASGHENHPSTGVSAWDWECGVCGQHVSAGERHFCEGQERQRHHLAGWECGLCGRIIPAGARHLCSGLRGHDGIAKAAYEVVEER